MSDRDALLDENRDFAVQGETGITVTGARLVAQDVQESILIPRGSLPWDRDDGSDVLTWLHLESTPLGTIIAELERVALADARIDAASVAAEQLPDGRYRLAFAVIGERGGQQEVVVG